MNKEIANMLKELEIRIELLKSKDYPWLMDLL
jgi:hypothetical protein